MWSVVGGGWSVRTGPIGTDGPSPTRSSDASRRTQTTMSLRRHGTRTNERFNLPPVWMRRTSDLIRSCCWADVLCPGLSRDGCAAARWPDSVGRRVDGATHDHDCSDGWCRLATPLGVKGSNDPIGSPPAQSSTFGCLDVNTTAGGSTSSAGRITPIERKKIYSVIRIDRSTNDP